MAEPAIMQRDNERRRHVATGTRTDDQGRCEMVAVAEVGGRWAFYPHGVSRFGVRLSTQEAEALARFILDGAR
jgi:hypothetical protein